MCVNHYRSYIYIATENNPNIYYFIETGNFNYVLYVHSKHNEGLLLRYSNEYSDSFVYLVSLVNKHFSIRYDLYQKNCHIHC